VNIKMAKAIVSFRVMPESPDVDLKVLEKLCMEKIKEFAGETEARIEIEPIAFGLKALKIKFVMDEDLGSTEPLEKSISEIENVSSMEILDVRRAIG
jgi:elongation factor 1-beta